MSSWETVEITTKRWSPGSHSDGYHCRKTSRGDRADYQELYHTKPLTKMLTEWFTGWSRNYRRTAYGTECETTILEAYQMTTSKPRNILPKLPDMIPSEISTKNTQKQLFEWLSPRSCYRDPTKCRIKRCRNLQMQCIKQLSESRSALVLRWVWPPTVMLMC